MEVQRFTYGDEPRGETMYWITVYHIDNDGKITKYDGGTDSYNKNSNSYVDPANALSTFWKYEHFSECDGWDWAMTPEEFNAKFAEGIRILHMEFMPQYGFRGTSLVEVQLDRIGHEE
jgi:hypothetical protein